MCSKNATMVGFLVLDAADRFSAQWADPPSREAQLEAVLDAAIGGGPPTFRLPASR